ncbi:MAG TPA: hypothetical protein VEH81_13270 [Ktedonobacteraceae bacterium]|nr:hypothetical protein [Ktedonobacteraceae bacterium]HYA99291.1 hypothetical protein [Ktedonobacteraceae bacterium]
MEVTTNTKTEHIPTKKTPGSGTTTLDEQTLRNEFKEASQQFFSTLLRVGVRLALTPVSILPEVSQEHFVNAAREFTRGFTSLAHECADTVDKIVEELANELKKDF